MPNDDEARKAIESLNGAEFMERNLIVNESQPRPEGEERPRRTFDNNRSGGGGGGYRGGNGGGGGGYNRGGNDRGNSGGYNKREY